MNCFRYMFFAIDQYIADMTTFVLLPKGFELEMEKKMVNADDILANYAPEKMSWLLPLINYLFPARAILVSCCLRRIGSVPALSFSIIDTTGKSKPEVYSVYADAFGLPIRPTKNDQQLFVTAL